MPTAPLTPKRLAEHLAWCADPLNHGEVVGYHRRVAAALREMGLGDLAENMGFVVDDAVQLHVVRD